MQKYTNLSIFIIFYSEASNTRFEKDRKELWSYNSRRGCNSIIRYSRYGKRSRSDKEKAIL